MEFAMQCNAQRSAYHAQSNTYMCVLECVCMCTHFIQHTFHSLTVIWDACNRSLFGNFQFFIYIVAKGRRRSWPAQISLNAMRCDPIRYVCLSSYQPSWSNPNQILLFLSSIFFFIDANLMLNYCKLHSDSRINTNLEFSFRFVSFRLLSA